jgi:exodeoxyribonuclease VII small subunit
MSKEINYHQLNQDLEAILDQLQGGDLDIDEAIKQYEKGMLIVMQLQDYLKQAENKVTTAKQSFEKK